jgi:alpha-beta hydrolase superfamily lysophospholipase
LVHTGKMLRGAFLVIAVVGLVVLLLWTLQRRLIYLPLQGPVPDAVDSIAGAQEVTLVTSDDLRLDAWFVPAREPIRKMTVLVAPGNAGHRGLRAPLAQALAEAGLSVLLVDYRGYGGNPGTPSEEGLARDVRAAYRYLVEDAGVAADRLLYYGESLGAAVVTELATEHPPAGLILRSPFVDLASVGRDHYPFVPTFLLKDRYELADNLARIEVPTTVIYGSQDSIVSPEQSQRVATAAQGPTHVVIVEGADHNDLALSYGSQLIDAVVDLADQVAQNR